MKRVLLLGAGHAHAVCLSRFGRGFPGKLTLVAPEPRQVYSGMAPGCIAGHYRLDEITIDFERLAQRAGAELVRGSVAALDAGRSLARLEDGRELGYDVASLNVGSLTAPLAGGAVPVKPLGALLDKLSRLRAGTAAVVGGGPGGAEVAMALAHRGLAVAIYDDAPVEPRLLRALRRLGIELRQERPQAAPQGFDLTIAATGPRAHPWLRASGLATDPGGFALVDDALRSVSHANVFAAGDCATLRASPHPKSGVYAVRHGPVLARNLRASLAGRELARYEPQRNALMLISCGGKYAIASWGALRAEGAWLWRVKDAIDRRWIARFR